ncbi:hypothetical protein ES705_42280 [subsurface metagenome]
MITLKYLYISIVRKDSLLMHTKKITPWLYIGPATFLLFFFLVYPSINTIYISFFNYNSEKFIGLKKLLLLFYQ